jgi:hypothetical protein
MEEARVPAQAPPLWLEFVRLIPSFVTAATAIYGVHIGIQGLNKWRAETIGKRKAELAEDVLADFYEARDIITAARSPGGFGHEGATRTPAEWESEDDTRTLNAYFRTIERLRNKEAFFAKLDARRYRFIAHFGLEAGRVYDDLNKIYRQIVIAVRMLISTYQQRNLGSLPDTRKAWEASIGWVPLDEDKVPAQLDALVFAIEKICRPAIQETFTDKPMA